MLQIDSKEYFDEIFRQVVSRLTGKDCYEIMLAAQQHVTLNAILPRAGAFPSPGRADGAEETDKASVFDGITRESLAQ